LFWLLLREEEKIFVSNCMNIERLAAIHNRLFLIRNSILALALLASWSCKRKAAVSPSIPAKPPESVETKPAPAAITPPAIPPVKASLELAPLDKTITTPTSFDLGEMSFQLGNYAKAAKYYEAFLNAFPKTQGRDTALYHLALCRALATDSSRDLNQTEAALRKLISEHPESRLKDQAVFILGLIGQAEKLRTEVKERDEKNKRLSEELQKLKDIDMQRRPSRTE
jgi:tetratricopeptide (TPR) repeat protein